MSDQLAHILTRAEKILCSEASSVWYLNSQHVSRYNREGKNSSQRYRPSLSHTWSKQLGEQAIVVKRSSDSSVDPIRLNPSVHSPKEVTIIFFSPKCGTSLIPSIPNLDIIEPDAWGLLSKSKHASRALRNSSCSFLHFSLSYACHFVEQGGTFEKQRHVLDDIFLTIFSIISISSTSVGMETTTLHNHKQHSFTNLLITISLQLLLWSSLFTLSVQISLFALSKVDKSLFLTDVICITAVSSLSMSMQTYEAYTNMMYRLEHHFLLYLYTLSLHVSRRAYSANGPK